MTSREPSKAFFGDLEQDPEYAAYLASLTSYSLEQLRTEPEQLQIERQRLQEDLINATAKHYKTFIDTADCLGDAKHSISSAQDSLSNVTERLPAISSNFDAFRQTSQTITAVRKANKIALQNHTRLLELLEVPQLLDTCVRNSYYDEALKLEDYVVEKMAKRHGDIPVVRTICEEVQKTMFLMTTQLLQQLRGQLPLPTCLKVVGHLRRMGIMDDTELRIRFLQNRGSWLDSLAAESLATPTTPYRLLNKLTDIMKTNFFEVVTQYKTVFPETAASMDSDFWTESHILGGWISRRVSNYISELQKGVEQVTDGGDLARLLDQCLYCGQSLSAVGADIRLPVVKIFEARVLNMFTNSLQSATTRVTSALPTFRFMPAALLKGLPTSLPESATASLAPPLSILQYQPLATFVNECISAFNELRKLALVSIVTPVHASVRTSLTQLVACVSSVFSAKGLDEKTDEYQNWMVLSKCVGDDIIPHIARCLSTVFPDPSKHPQLKGALLLLDHREIAQALPHMVVFAKQQLVLQKQREEEAKKKAAEAQALAALQPKPSPPEPAKPPAPLKEPEQPKPTQPSVIPPTSDQTQNAALEQNKPTEQHPAVAEQKTQPETVVESIEPLPTNSTPQEPAKTEEVVPKQDETPVVEQSASPLVENTPQVVNEENQPVPVVDTPTQQRDSLNLEQNVATVQQDEPSVDTTAPVVPVAEETQAEIATEVSQSSTPDQLPSGEQNIQSVDVVDSSIQQLDSVPSETLKTNETTAPSETQNETDSSAPEQPLVAEQQGSESSADVGAKELPPVQETDSAHDSAPSEPNDTDTPADPVPEEKQQEEESQPVAPSSIELSDQPQQQPPNQEELSNDVPIDSIEQVAADLSPSTHGEISAKSEEQPAVPDNNEQVVQQSPEGHSVVETRVDPETPSTSPEQPTNDLLPSTVLTWSHGGSTVSVAGSFNAWQPQPMTKDETTGIFSVKISGEPGTYQFKFVVDGQWVTNSDLPVAKDSSDNLNNEVSLGAAPSPQEQSEGAPVAVEDSKEPEVAAPTSGNAPQTSSKKGKKKKNRH